MSPQAWLALAVAALAVAIAGWHDWRLRRLLRQMESRHRLQPPEGHGRWSELQRLLVRHQDEARLRKRRLVDRLGAYRAVANALPDAVVVIERNTQRILWFNDAATPLLGLRFPRDRNASIVTATAPLPMAQWLAMGRKAEPMNDVPSPANESLRLNVRLIPYSDAFWLLVARDVSKLTHLEQMRRDFVANVSHELRTPLTVLHGYLDILEPDEDDDEGARMFNEMRQQSSRMAQLVEDLLTLSRLEAQEHQDEEQVSMASMLATLRREAEALSRGRHRITVADQAGVDLVGSTKELHSAFSNLISNAVRYTPADGAITVTFAREGAGAALRVQDSGFGIPPMHLPRITERFYRVSTSRSRESGGTGLGLSIVKHVLNNHGARLEIASEVGKGSTFTCHFDATRVATREP